MKMADGGFRPAYNLQFASLPETGIVVAVSCGNVGSDRALAKPMAQAIETAYGRRADVYLVDGGYMASKDIEAAERAGTRLYCPATTSKWGVERYAPRRGDTPAMARWRVRMDSQEGRLVYKRRARCELVHARFRNSASIACGCAAGRRSKPALAGSRSPPTSSPKPGCAPPPRRPDRPPNRAASGGPTAPAPSSQPTKMQLSAAEPALRDLHRIPRRPVTPRTQKVTASEDEVRVNPNAIRPDFGIDLQD